MNKMTRSQYEEIKNEAYTLKVSGLIMTNKCNWAIYFYDKNGVKVESTMYDMTKDEAENRAKELGYVEPNKLKFWKDKIRMICIK